MARISQDTVRFNRNDVAGGMTVFRDKVRKGLVRVIALPGRSQEASFRIEVASQFGIRATDFNTEFFSPSTLKRFADLFAIPVIEDVENTLGGVATFVNPTQDEIAWAVQNFVNRRKDPWANFRAKYQPDLGVDASEPKATYVSEARGDFPKLVHKLDEQKDPLEILDGDVMVENSEAEDNEDIAERFSRA